MKLSPVLLLLMTLSIGQTGTSQEAKPSSAQAGNTKAVPATPAPAGTTATEPAASAKPQIKVRGASSSPLDNLFKLVEIGRTHEGVRYPLFEDGIMTSMILSERMTRLDNNLLEMENAVIDQRADDPIKFYLQRATFNRLTDQLLSSQPTRIEGKAYEIEGDTMSYDRKNNVARLDGRVRMIVYDTKAKQPAGNDKSPPAAPAPPGRIKPEPVKTK